jgi:hypothetical protein
MTDIRKAFERCTESCYEGDFAKYADGDYVSPTQQDDFVIFKSGYQAARTHDIGGLIAEIEKASWNERDGEDGRVLTTSDATSIIRKRFGKE